MYIKFLPSEYVLRYRNGKIVGEGAGLSFFFFEKNTAACMIPISNNDADFVLEERTIDHQSVMVQGQLTVTSMMAENGVIFSDGVEEDYLQFNAGTIATISLAHRVGHLVL
ncbi:MAG: hypothetical protein IJI67_09450 [Clostridia bacterium]|nr:hypothetical protein [Clostridia bacterium]